MSNPESTATSTCGCGGRTAATEVTPRAGQPAAAPCCGTADNAAAAGACCDPAAKSDALAAGARCSG